MSILSTRLCSKGLYYVYLKIYTQSFTMLNLTSDCLFIISLYFLFFRTVCRKKKKRTFYFIFVVCLFSCLLYFKNINFLSLGTIKSFLSCICLSYHLFLLCFLYDCDVLWVVDRNSVRDHLTTLKEIACWIPLVLFYFIDAFESDWFVMEKILKFNKKGCPFWYSYHPLYIDKLIYKRNMEQVT